MKPASCKAKGALLQKWVRDKILEQFPVLTKDDVRSTSMGAGGEDVLLSAAARKLVPFQIECKNKNKVSVCGWYDQAGAHGEHEPIVIFKQNYGRPLVALDAEHFLSILKQLNDR